MKKSLKKKTLLYTHPVFIIGTYDEKDVPNIMAVSWGGICCSEPPCISISLRKATYSYHNIMNKKAFTVNMPSAKHVNEADFSGTFSGKDMNKFEELGLTAVKSELVDAPYVEEFPAAMICRLIETHELGLHTQFIGEILDVVADEDTLNEKGLPDMDKVNPFIYDSSSRSYFSIGEKLVNAYSAKKK